MVQTAIFLWVLSFSLPRNRASSSPNQGGALRIRQLYGLGFSTVTSISTLPAMVDYSSL